MGASKNIAGIGGLLWAGVSTIWLYLAGEARDAISDWLFEQLADALGITSPTISQVIHWAILWGPVLAFPVAIYLVWRVSIRRTPQVVPVTGSARHADADLGEEMVQTSQAILELLGQAKRLEPLLPRTETCDDADARSRHSRMLMADYDQEFSAKALWLLDEAVRRGYAVGEGGRRRAEHPTNPLGIREVATTLGVLGQGLKRK